MQRVIDEIESCQNEQYGFAALALALIIPSVCASYRTGKQAGRQDYIKWCNDWIQCSGDIDGDIIYALRCAYFHAMDGDLEQHPAFVGYREREHSFGEKRKLSYRFFFPHEDTKEPVIYKKETDVEITRTICIGMLVRSIIDGHKQFTASTPAFLHDYTNFWFEG